MKNDMLLEKFKQRTGNFIDSELERLRFGEFEKVVLVTSQGVRESGLYREKSYVAGLSVYEVLLGKTKIKVIDANKEGFNILSRFAYEHLKRSAKAHLVFNTKEEFEKQLYNLL